MCAKPRDLLQAGAFLIIQLFSDMKQPKNAFELNHILVNRNRRSGLLEYTLVIHKGKSTAAINITESQFSEAVAELQLKEEPSLTHEENKVYIIQ